MNDIEIEKSFNLLPYLSSNVSGSRDNYNEKLNYTNPELNYGLGLNIDITKNVSFEATLNPDFSQVEADVTQIDVNSPTEFTTDSLTACSAILVAKVPTNSINVSVTYCATSPLSLSVLCVSVSNE